MLSQLSYVMGALTLASALCWFSPCHLQRSSVNVEQVKVPKWDLFFLCSGSHLEKHSA